MQQKRFNKLKKQLGFGLIEAMAVLLIVGVGAAVVLNYQAKATATQDTQNAIKSFVGSSGSYNGLTGKIVNQLAPVMDPLTFDGTNIKDPNGNIMNWVGNAVGASASYVATYGGTTKAISSESCAQFASGLGKGADVIIVGGDTTPATTTNGIAGGGFIYKTAAGVVDPVKLASGCGEANPVIVVQMH